MARRKAEAVERVIEEIRQRPGKVVILPDDVSIDDLDKHLVGISEPVTWPDLSKDGEANYTVEVKDRRPSVGLNGSPRHDALDAIIARMAGLGSMTDRAALNVVAVSLAQLAEVLRDD